MTGAPAAQNVDAVPVAALVPFVLITFGIAWGVFCLFLFAPDAVTAVFGEISGRNPLFYLAVWAPGIAAVVLVLRYAGLRGLRGYLRRLALWRCSPAWYAFVLLGIPLLFVAGVALKGDLDEWSAWSGTAGSLATALLLMLFLGPVEEFGWRGLALPLAQRRLAPFWAGLAVGIVWALWHFPAFLLSGTPQGAWSFTPFFLGSVGAALIVTALFNASRGSILLPLFFHFWLNNPLWPDAQPYDMYLFCAAAVVVVWLNRTAMFSRQGAAIGVVESRYAKPYA
ncbi:CPBP family glutamic-type intramembrane protease [Lentisalinibacter salinarum]|uniref:CPBP family glutamic-type intramembrane protease n=1 Tax=Lentisalinibacter salinarum TaxID=2992239 RepID=UPI00386DC411